MKGYIDNYSQKTASTKMSNKTDRKENKWQKTQLKESINAYSKEQQQLQKK